MALINCPECNKEISDKAGKCPNCGAPPPSQKASTKYVLSLVVIGAVAVISGITLINKYVQASHGSSKMQKVIYEAQSISYRRGDSLWTSKIQKECSDISTNLSQYLNDGWKVVTSSPKEKMVYGDIGTCVGTEYVLEK